MTKPYTPPTSRKGFAILTAALDHLLTHGETPSTALETICDCGPTVFRAARVIHLNAKLIERKSPYRLAVRFHHLPTGAREVLWSAREKVR